MVDNERDLPRILLVEDEPDVLHTTEALFSHSGFAVSTAAHAAAALDAIAGEKPDLIITDYMMPWMNGRQFAEKLKAQETTRDIPVILLSAVPQPDGPWDRFLLKPAKFRDLLAAVRELLAARRRD